MFVVQLSVPNVRLILAKDMLAKASQDTLAEPTTVEDATENGSPPLVNVLNVQ